MSKIGPHGRFDTRHRDRIGPGDASWANLHCIRLGQQRHEADTIQRQKIRSTRQIPGERSHRWGTPLRRRSWIRHSGATLPPSPQPRMRLTRLSVAVLIPFSSEISFSRLGA